MNLEEDPGSTMALLTTGDWWEYDGTGRVEREPPLALHGTVRITVETRVAGGRTRSALVIAPTWRVADVDGPEGVSPMPGGVFYFEQDPLSRALAISGDTLGPGGSDRFAIQPQLFYPGRFGADTAYDNVLDFGPHGRVANTLHTTGIEVVETALGRLAAWRAPISSTSELFGRVDGCDWWRPGLGAPLRFEMTATGPDGTRLWTSAVLKATNRALA